MANTVTFQTQREDGTWKTWRNIAVPVKYGTLLDEQLDYAVVTLARVKRKQFKPMTRAKLTITSNTEHGGEQPKTMEYFIANDDAFETPIGSGAYNHELTLIELTKFLECFPLESLCFTNPNGNDYLKGAMLPNFDTNATKTSIIGYKESGYLTPSVIGTVYNLLDLDPGYNAVGAEMYYTGNFEDNKAIKIENKEGTRYLGVGKYSGKVEGDRTFKIEEGPNIVTYSFDNNSELDGVYDTTTETTTFIIYGVKNKYPLKPWTVNDVIQRVLQLVEPIRVNGTPRFSFTPPTDKKAKLFTQFAPEFTFTRMTLREALQTVGGFIHAEPRLTENNEIEWDYYGEQEYATVHNYRTRKDKRLSGTKYRALQSVFGVEQACTKLDSYQQNLVNRLAWEQGTTEQPYKGGAQTLRTESAYIRGEEKVSFFFPTVQGIDRVVKFEYVDNAGASFDITPYIFEKKVYDALSSFDGVYPTSKAYAIYYTQGATGINGLFFKQPSEIAGGAFNEYAIVNILGAVGATIPKSNDENAYNEMKFRLSYVPIYSTRVQQSKPYLMDYLPLPRVLNYNQTDNSVETRFFGENIKGAVSRMGNPEKTYTINLRNINNIPKAGQLWDDEYYIASVSVAVDLDMFEVSVGLSKNFNRKSQYIGANSIKRIYEVSEEMVQQRHTIYTDYMVATKGESHPIDFDGTTYLNANGVETISRVFCRKDLYKETEGDITAVWERGYTKQKTGQEPVLLPVISSAFGNTMEFSWEYKDNFSAGIQSVDIKNGDVIKGKFGKETEYADYYGRLWSSKFRLLTEKAINNVGPSGKQDADLLPETNSAFDETYKTSAIAGTGDSYVLLRKDSREALKKSYVIEFVTDEPAFIIGSALASKNPLVYHVGDKWEAPKLYLLKNRVNKLATHINEEDIVGELLPNDPVSIQGGSFSRGFRISGKRATAEGKAWAYAIPLYDGDEYMVEDEDGDATPITPKLGGDILLAENIDFAPGVVVGEFSMMLCSDVFKYMKEKRKNIQRAPILSIEGSVLTVKPVDNDSEEFALYVNGMETVTIGRTFDLNALSLAVGEYEIWVEEKGVIANFSNSVSYIVLPQDYFDMIIENIYFGPEGRDKAPLIGSEAPDIITTEDGNTIFVWQSLGLEIVATNIKDGQWANLLNLMAGQKVTFYPYKNLSDYETNEGNKFYEFTIKITYIAGYNARLTCTIAGYNSPITVVEKDGLFWKYPPNEITFKYDTKTGLGSIILKDWPATSKTNVDFSKGVTIEVLE